MKRDKYKQIKQTVSRLITEAWETEGYDPETTEHVSQAIRGAFMDQGIDMEMINRHDDNEKDYEVFKE